MSHGLSEFMSIAQQLVRERAAARPIVEMVRRNPTGYLGHELPEDWRTAGMVEQLTAAANELVQASPEQSAALAELATNVAAHLDAAAYPHVMRAQLAAVAWKELATAYRYRSDYGAALHALDRADEQIAAEPALGYDQAILTLARGITLRELDRLSEADLLVEQAAEVFRGYSDNGRVAQCELVTGMIAHRQGRIADARHAYVRAAVAAREAGDVRTAASAYVNLGVVDAERGHTSASLDSLQQARAIFRELDAHVELARTTCWIGVALLGNTKYAAALPLLREAREAFLKLGMPEEAALVGVQFSEAHLALEDRTAAREVIVKVIEELRAANLNERAIVALAYLRDLGPEARPQAAQHVHSYLTRLRREPTLLFLPLDEH